MAVIFFDGFNRDINDAQWSRPDEAAVVLSGTVRTNSGPQSILIMGDDTLDKRLVLSNIGTHSAKKLYLGFVMHNFVNDSNDDSLYPNGRPLLRFYNSSNAVVLTVAFDTTSTGTNSQLSLGKNIDINMLQSNTIVDSYRVGLSSDHYSQRIVGYSGSNTWIYYEFEIDLASTPNTVAMRINGVPLVNLNSTQKTNLTPISNISKLEFIGARQRANYYAAYYTFIDDFYLIDDTGSRENTWLGPDTIVRNIEVQNSNFDSAVIDNQWYSTGDYQRLYSDDGDTSTIRSTAFNQFQIYNWSDISPSSLLPGTLVGGVRISTKAKNASLPAAYRIVGRNSGGTIYDLSNKYVMSDYTYKTRGPEYILNNPETGDRWTIAEFNSFGFGVKSENPV